MDFEKSFHFEQAQNASILGIFTSCGKQPAIHGLSFVGAGFNYLRLGGAGVLAQKSHHPQFQWMHADHVAAITQRKFLGCIFFKQRFCFDVIGLVVSQIMTEEIA